MARSEVVLALDQGTTSTRAMLFDFDGRIVEQAQKEHRQILPRPGWVEHDACEIRDNSLCLIQEVLHFGNTQPVALGVTNQRETVLLWDRLNGEPLTPAVVWQDTRTADQISLLARKGEDRLREKTGLPLATYFSASKIAWLLDHTPGLRSRAEKGQVLCGTIDSWLIWNLTGGVRGGSHVTDITNASRTQLMDLERLDWSSELLDLFQIPAGILPRIVPSVCRTPLGFFTSNDARIPIHAALGDQQAALFGQTCFEAGEAKNTYGTGCFLLLNTGTQVVHSRSGLLTTPAYQWEGQSAYYALEGSVAIAGALVQWLRDNLGLIQDSDEIEALALTVPDNGGIYLVPAFSGLFAPYWKRDARGALLGLTRFSNKGHLARAALEASAFQTWELYRAMQQDAGLDSRPLKVDGGMTVNHTLMQFQSDILGLQVVRPVIRETTALGAAYGAGLGCGFWQDKEELRSHWKAEKVWQPQMDDSRVKQLQAEWLRAVTRTFDWVQT